MEWLFAYTYPSCHVPHSSILVHHVNSLSSGSSLLLSLPYLCRSSCPPPFHPSLPKSLSPLRSRKVKPPRRLTDENGIRMKARFQIMKICKERLGGLGGVGEVQIKIKEEIGVPPFCYFTSRVPSGKHDQKYNEQGWGDTSSLDGVPIHDKQQRGRRFAWDILRISFPGRGVQV